MRLNNVAEVWEPVENTLLYNSNARLIPRVTLIIPCRNEARFIGPCLQSVIESDCKKEQVEILVVDGMSEDETRDIVEHYSRFDRRIRLLDNPDKITPCALNIGIAHAAGDIIIRMDAHASYPKDYISKCVKALDEHAADNVGGIWRIIPRSDSLIGRAIVNVLSHWFGVGGAHYRLATATTPRWVDTVPFFCCRKTLFDRIGNFNERLVRGQDMEFNLRLRKVGGRTLLLPEIVSHYYARSDMSSFVKHNWSNGVWAILPFLYSEVMPVSWRHLVPLAFVTALMVLGIGGLFTPLLALMFSYVIGLYLAASLAVSAQIAFKERDPRYIFIIPVVFAALHLVYGLGSVWGVVRVLIGSQLWKKLFRHEARHGVVTTR